MTSDLTDWDQDLETSPEEDYQALVRSLKWTQGFSLYFIRCAPVDGKRIIGRVVKDIPDKKIEHLVLKERVDTLYDRFEQMPNIDDLNVLFISGIEKSLIDYIKPGYGGVGDYYKLDSVPAILGHLNLQRERFRERFHCCFVFLVPLFALKYFIRRAPDFFDWQSGVWEFNLDRDLIPQESSRIRIFGEFEVFLALSAQERTEKILLIQELLQEANINAEERANLLHQQGIHFYADQNYEAAISSYDKALQLKSNYYYAWNNRGTVLYDLGQYEAAITSYDEALKIKPDFSWPWNNRGTVLYDLGQYEAAIASYDKALNFEPDDHEVWNNRGIALYDLGQYEAAIASYDKALKFKPDLHEAWYNRGIALYDLGQYEAAIASYDKALQIKQNYQKAKEYRNYALQELERKADTSKT